MDTELNVKIGDVSRFLEKLTELTQDTTMPMQQVRCLLALYVHPQIAQQDLNKHIGVDKSAISRTIHILGAGIEPKKKQGPGLVQSVQDIYNRKCFNISLTPKGRALVAEAAKQAFIPKGVQQ